ncbi:MAG: VWA domain-containing protein [Spirulina sp. SIO3F2]|nr:VWA domain-containing protein [Spirulina sp. SIO3F2]
MYSAKSVSRFTGVLISAIAATLISSCNQAPPETSNSGAELESVQKSAPATAQFDTDDIQLPAEAKSAIAGNAFRSVLDHPLSTFSIDVDTAAYTNTRRHLNTNQLPAPDVVRLEEFINYFNYDYPQPEGDAPFSITTELTTAPWNSEHELLLVGLQGQRLATEALPPNNLVFLLDVSGSMNEPDKLPLLKAAMKLLVEQMDGGDRIAIVVYAGAAGLVLEPTPGNEAERILGAIDSLAAGGSTAGGAGIELAYRVAQENFLPEGNNRVILATDGDFKVGPSSDEELVRLIEQKREAGVFLTVLGFGTGNYQDTKMEKLADKGNGNYAYLDSLQEAKKALVTEMGGTLVAIAKDVKFQIEFNPALVKEYRLLGYENRVLNDEDFNDDRKDAGELGAGHSVTALYEIIPAGSAASRANVDSLVYQPTQAQTPAVNSTDLLTLKLRYKRPDGNTSQLIQQAIQRDAIWQTEPSLNLQFASAVAEFGLLLRDSPYKADANYRAVLTRATNAQGADLHGYRAEFVNLVEQAERLSQEF